MERRGSFDPETEDAVTERYEELGPVARNVLREAARAMGFDSEEYRERVTEDVVETVREALFAADLRVTIGDRSAFEDWKDTVDVPVTTAGTDMVDNVAWHAPGFADAAVAVTFQDEPHAAVETLRRQAFGRLYRDRL